MSRAIAEEVATSTRLDSRRSTEVLDRQPVERRKAENIARSTFGVLSVQNNLRLERG
jgi:hypothetical protein